MSEKADRGDDEGTEMAIIKNTYDTVKQAFQDIIAPLTTRSRHLPVED